MHNACKYFVYIDTASNILQLQSLKTLNLSNNKIFSMENVENLFNLRVLNMSHNKENAPKSVKNLLKTAITAGRQSHPCFEKQAELSEDMKEDELLACLMEFFKEEYFSKTK